MHGNLAKLCLCSCDSTSMDVPASDSFGSRADRAGWLRKLVGRGWLSAGSWRRRWCVLSGARLYYYEDQKSNGTDKNCGIIDLDSYDLCEEGKDKKNPHVFVIGTTVRGFFDNRHQFAAETSEDLAAWSAAVRSAMQTGTSPQVEPRLAAATKDRVKGPKGRRPPQRRSMAVWSSEMSKESRSVSLSNPLIEEDSTFDSSNGSARWKSLESVDRSQADDSEEAPPNKHGDIRDHHAALARELEVKLKIPPKRPPSSSAEELRRGAHSSDHQDTRIDELLQKLSYALQEAQRVGGECHQALESANRAREEYVTLSRDCRALMETLRQQKEEKLKTLVEETDECMTE